jgi:5-methylcytosine-specific restriction protein B
MARYLDHDNLKIFDVSELFRSNCLLSNGSLLFQGTSLWHPSVLDGLRSAFIDAPDEGDRKFMAKLRDQIGKSGPEVIRLAAEMLIIYFLFPSNVGGPRKREVVGEVLSWAGDTLPDDHIVSLAFNNGIGSGGQAYNTRRPFELAFLIKLVIEWKKRSPENQAAMASDPWEFQAFVDGIEDSGSRQLRHMLLYLLFPDAFERISSRNHKRIVIEKFSSLVADRPEDDDRLILAIRRELELLLPNRELDFYWSPIKETWNAGRDDASSSQLEVIQHKKQIVLYGPPGTGKTYQAKKLAETIIRSAALRKMGPADYFRSQTEVAESVQKNYHRLQLHPAYSYEDFVRALHISTSGGTEYRKGYLPRLIEEIEKEPRTERLPHVLILDEMNRTDLSRMLGECFSLLEDRNQSIELPAHGANGEPMTLRIPDDLFVIGTMNLIDQSIEQVDFALRRRFLWQECRYDREALIAAAQATWIALDTGLKWQRVEPDFRKLAGAAKALNEEIHNSQLLGEQYEIGHTYMLDAVIFLRDFLGPRPTLKQIYLWDKKGSALDPVTQVWNLSLRPLLEQYLSGESADERRKLLEHLGKTFLDFSGTE